MFVSEFSVWVTMAHERYISAKKLVEKSKDDPPTNPYRSKYEAAEILKLLTSELEKKWNSLGNIQVKLLYALFNYEIGIICLETDETSAGCAALNVSWEYIKDLANAPEGCHLALKILNRLGIIWSERGEHKKALDFLLQAETIYNTYKSSHNICPYDSEDMFVLENVGEKNYKSFEETFTYTLYFIAQVYESEEDNETATDYCYRTLKRQRESGHYDPIDWGVNCATISNCYRKRKMFEKARHLLCCAFDSLTKEEDKLDSKEVNEERDVWGEFHEAQASVSCCFIKYYIAILQESHNKVNTNDQLEQTTADTQLTNDQLEKTTADVRLINDQLEQTTIDARPTNQLEQTATDIRLTNDQGIVAMENKIPIHVSSYDEAKNIFLLAVGHVTEAKKHYTLNQYANNYVQIVQDHSALYKCLAYFESDLSRECKMFKRRIDMLEEVLRKMNPQYYLAVCRQLQFELGEIYFEMMDNKFKIAHALADNLNSNAIKKINSLINQGINHFSNFIKSLQDKNGKDPDTFSVDNVRPALIAYFYLGRFYSKILECDMNRKLHNLLKSEECYKNIVNYIEKNPDHLCYIENEFPIAKDMIELMPERISQLSADAANVLF